MRALYPTMKSLFEAYESLDDNRGLREELLVNARVSSCKSTIGFN